MLLINNINYTNILLCIVTISKCIKMVIRLIRIREVKIPRFQFTGTGDIHVPVNWGIKLGNKIGEKTDQRMATFAVDVRHKLLKTLTSICALFIWVRCWKFVLFKRPKNSKQKTLYRGETGRNYRIQVKLLTSAKIGKPNGDTRTRSKPEPGYLNLSIIDS